MKQVLVNFLLAVPLSALLVAFASACGAIHGAPACGAFSYVAAPLVVFALLIERAVYAAPQSEGTVMVLLWVAAYVVSLIIVFPGFWVWRAMRGRPGL